MVQGLHAVYLISSCRLPPAGGQGLACMVWHITFTSRGGLWSQVGRGTIHVAAAAATQSQWYPPGRMRPCHTCHCYLLLVPTPIVLAQTWLRAGRQLWGWRGSRAPLHTGCYTGQARVCVVGRGRVVDAGLASPHRACLEGHAYSTAAAGSEGRCSRSWAANVICGSRPRCLMAAEQPHWADCVQQAGKCVLCLVACYMR
jgi:hypothetical protein